jgi:hypothetical protein
MLGLKVKGAELGDFLPRVMFELPLDLLNSFAAILGERQFRLLAQLRMSRSRLNENIAHRSSAIAAVLR